MSYKEGLSYCGVLMLGAMGGFVVGLLTAPASGEETRRRLSSSLDEGKSRLRQTGRRVVDDAATRLEHGIETGKQKLDQMLRS